MMRRYSGVAMRDRAVCLLFPQRPEDNGLRILDLLLDLIRLPPTLSDRSS